VSVKFIGILFILVPIACCFARVNTEIKSDSVEVVDLGSCLFFSFSGNVTAASDGLELSSDRLEVTSDGRDVFLQSGARGKSIKSAHAFGNVQVTQDCRRGTADELAIDPVRGTITLLGNATVADGNGTACSDRLILYRDSGSIRVESAGRPTISMDSFKKNQATGEDLEPCNGGADSAGCRTDD
jgi:lipopolysaccharide export system protein LptA